MVINDQIYTDPLDNAGFVIFKVTCDVLILFIQCLAFAAAELLFLGEKTVFGISEKTVLKVIVAIIALGVVLAPAVNVITKELSLPVITTDPAPAPGPKTIVGTPPLPVIWFPFNPPPKFPAVSIAIVFKVT